jgi:glutamate-ammonia-ligase adenylyltransferase
MKDLELLAVHLGQTGARRIAAAARRSFDPDAAIAAFGRLAHALASTPADRLIEPLTALFEASDFVPRLLAARPGLLRWIAGSQTLRREKSAEEFEREAQAAVRRTLSDKTQLVRRLRRYKYRELLRLMFREVALQAPVAAVSREMSLLATAIIKAALWALEQGLRARYGEPSEHGFCVLGLGKLGGEDLNFSSDVDLVYLYRADGHTSGGAEGSQTNVQFYTRLAELLTQALSASEPEGFCFRVDLNLRPQGRSGAIALSLPATCSYYETFGRPWERAALLKMKLVAGDAGLGGELLECVSPFVWRRTLDLAVVNELRDLKEQIDLRGKASRTDVKLGPGGIREVEFFANALQLLHGGRRPSLRERNTIRALRKLESEGLISSTDADGLEEAYLFLRRVENRLQMAEERQTHALPSGEKERGRLAASLGFHGWPGFERELERHRGVVQDAFSKLLGQTAREELPDDPKLALALDIELAEEERLRALAGLGFASPERALSFLEALSRVAQTSFESGAAGPSLQSLKRLSELVRTPDPDQALLHFSELIGQVRARPGYLSFLAQAPQAQRRLLNLFGQSDFLSRYFIQHPELLDLLVQTGISEVHKEPLRIRQELSMRLGRCADAEERLSAMRRFKNEEVLRVGLNDISGDLQVQEVALQLTSIAEAVLDEALLLASEELSARYGDPLGASGLEQLAVIGMGKLGGQELGYQSDLDLIFVYSGGRDAETSGGSRGRLSHHEYFTKWAQRLLHFMHIKLREGHLYAVDARLRPSGNKGTLVVSQQAFRDHQERRAQLWERQALIKARGVAGDSALFQRLRSEVIEPLTYDRPLPEHASAEIHRMRQRMEREIAREDNAWLNPKTGHGGLVDVEFTTQYLQLLHGGALASVRTPNTLEALDALAAERCIPRADAEILRQGYLFHRRVENRLRLVHGFSLEQLPTSGRPLALLARRLGYFGGDPGSAFLSDYRSYTDRVREVYARIFQTHAD